MSYTAITNHKTITNTIHKGVFNRIGFIEQNQPNADIISNYIVEACNYLEPCLKISLKDDTGATVTTADLTRVADETKYNDFQKSLIADVVAIYMLRRIAAINAAGAEADATTGQVVTTANKDTFISSVKAGSVGIQYDQFNTSAASTGGTTATSSGVELTAEKLITQYEKSAFSKGQSLGCLLDVCSSCLANVLSLQSANATASGEVEAQATPFISVQP